MIILLRIQTKGVKKLHVLSLLSQQRISRPPHLPLNKTVHPIFQNLTKEKGPVSVTRSQLKHALLRFYSQSRTNSLPYENQGSFPNPNTFKMDTSFESSFRILPVRSRTCVQHRDSSELKKFGVKVCVRNESGEQNQDTCRTRSNIPRAILAW